MQHEIKMLLYKIEFILSKTEIQVLHKFQNRNICMNLDIHYYTKIVTHLKIHFPNRSTNYNFHFTLHVNFRWENNLDD